MRPRTPRVCAAIALVACGCSYDWSLPAASSPPDAGGEIDATTPLDSGSPDAPDASDAAVDSPAVDTGMDGASCAALFAAADSAYTQARKCTIGDSCTTAKDRCGCDVPVDSPSNASTDAYEEAVAAISSSGCEAPCSPCTTPAVKCVDSANGEGGIATLCE